MLRHVATMLYLRLVERPCVKGLNQFVGHRPDVSRPHRQHEVTRFHTLHQVVVNIFIRFAKDDIRVAVLPNELCEPL